MALKTTPDQARRVKALVRRKCCNCDDDHCLLLGAEQCVQLICQHGIYCKYFLQAVLPGDKALYQEIIKQNGGIK